MSTLRFEEDGEAVAWVSRHVTSQTSLAEEIALTIERPSQRDIALSHLVRYLGRPGSDPAHARGLAEQMAMPLNRLRGLAMCSVGLFVDDPAAARSVVGEVEFDEPDALSSRFVMGDFVDAVDLRVALEWSNLALQEVVRDACRLMVLERVANADDHLAVSQQVLETSSAQSRAETRYAEWNDVAQPATLVRRLESLVTSDGRAQFIARFAPTIAASDQAAAVDLADEPSSYVRHQVRDAAVVNSQHVLGLVDVLARTPGAAHSGPWQRCLESVVDAAQAPGLEGMYWPWPPTQWRIEVAESLRRMDDRHAQQILREICRDLCRLLRAVEYDEYSQHYQEARACGLLAIETAASWGPGVLTVVMNELQQDPSEAWYENRDVEEALLERNQLDEGAWRTWRSWRGD